MRRQSLIVTALLLGLGGASCLLSPGCSPARRPNVLFILVDTLRADHLEPYGYERPISPRLSALAAEGAVFERAYTHAPWTAPSVASMLTGLSPRDHGLTQWNQRLRPDLVRLPQVLEADGYDTLAVISHTVFRRHLGFAEGFQIYDTSVLAAGAPGRNVSSQAVTRLALEALDGREPTSDRPFLLWCHYFDPHSQYIPHPDWPLGEDPIDRYDSEIAQTDHEIGRLLEGLEARDLARDTYVVVVADHGEEFGDHGGEQHSSTLFEELVRIPLLIRGPGIEPQRVGEVVRESDIAPTLLALLGRQPPAEWTGEPIPVEDGRFVVGTTRPVFMETLRFANLRGMVRGRHKIIRDLENERIQLYDLHSDPEERRNLAHTRAVLRDELLSELDAYYEQERASSPRREVSDEEERQLEALGYLDTP